MLYKTPQTTKSNHSSSTNHISRCHIHMGFKCLQGWGLQPLPRLGHPFQWRNVSLYPVQTFYQDLCSIPPEVMEDFCWCLGATQCGICVWRKKRKKTGQNQYIEINVPLWRFKTDGEKVKDSLLLSAFLWQLRCVCYEWAVICSSCRIIKGAAFPADLGMLVMAYLLCAYPSADQVSTGRTQPVGESFSQSQCTATEQAGMSLAGSGWQSAHFTGCWGSFARNPGRLIKIQSCNSVCSLMMGCSMMLRWMCFSRI